MSSLGPSEFLSVIAADCQSSAVRPAITGLDARTILDCTPARLAGGGGPIYPEEEARAVE